MSLPTQRAFQAFAHRVHAPLCAIEVEIELGFKILTQKIIKLIGIDIEDIPTHQREAATSCLISLCRNRRKLIIVLPDPDKSGQLYVPAKVFIDEPLSVEPPIPLSVPFSVPDTEPLLEVGAYMRWLMVKGFPVREVHPLFDKKIASTYARQPAKPTAI